MPITFPPGSVNVTLGADPGADFLVSSATSSLGNSRTLAVAGGLTLQDGGPRSTLTISGSISANVSSSYLVLSPDAANPNERTLVAGTNITLTDNGPGSTLVITAPTRAGANTGTSIMDFGSPPGTNVTSSIVVGQTNILSNSIVQAFLMASTTVSGSVGHNAEEHKLVPINLTCGNIIPGVGFSIYADSEWRLDSTFLVAWLWN